MASTKTWIWVVAGFLGVCVLVLFAIAGTGVYFVSQHIATKTTSSADALHEFDTAREALKGKTPLLELDRLGRPRQLRRTESMPTSPVRPTDMVILAWNPDRGHIVRVSLPFWLLHFGRRKVDLLDNSQRLRHRSPEHRHRRAGPHRPRLRPRLRDGERRARAGLDEVAGLRLSLDEIGIRMALGADRQAVRRLILTSSLRPVVVGAGLGMLAAVAAAQWARSL